jgi:C4-dicarboxylate-specific signal transduction histidine kinase
VHVDRLGQRIEKIIDNIQLFARDGKSDPLENTRLRDLIENATEVINARFEKAGVKLEIDAIGDVKVSGRVAQLSQVLLNLLTNSFDAVKGLSEKWIRVTVEENLSDVVIIVSDSGHGIPEPLREHLMRPYFTTKPVGQGTGLGLSISREIVEAHGGNLNLDYSKPSTTFVITLPKISLPSD